jgi:hypothetical protein
VRQHRSLTFNEWLEHCFGHEVRMHGNPWYFDPDTPHWDPPADEALSHLVGLFENPVSALENYADSQISQGLTYLVNTMASGDCGWFYSRAVSVSDRLRAISAIYSLFDQLFQPRCAPILLHVDEEGVKPLNSNCYMWWDSFPSVASPDDPHRLILHDAVLAVMEKILTSIPSPAKKVHCTVLGIGNGTIQGLSKALSTDSCSPTRRLITDLSRMHRPRGVDVCCNISNLRNQPHIQAN